MPTTRLGRLVAAALSVIAVAACGDESTDAADTTAAQPSVATSASGASGAFSVTIEHAFGETIIAGEPIRVVAWGWGSADAAIALGVVPVAIPFQEYGGDSNGVLRWIHEAVEQLQAEIPTVLPNAEDPPFEAIASAQPDVILAAYSGITESDYALLSEIAPTVAYPGEAWATPWRDLIRIVGTALGRDDEADAVLNAIDDQVAAQAAAHPELVGKSVAMVWDAAGTFYVYKPADPRVEFTLDLGLVSAPSVSELSTDDESTFYLTLSHENLAQLTSDILVSYADTPEASRAFLESAPAQLMQQVTDGTVAEVTGPDFIASVSPPTALSLTWGLDEYVALLSSAAQAADAAAG